MPKRKREERYPLEITYCGVVFILKNKRGRPKKSQGSTPSHYESVDGTTRLALDFVELYLTSLQPGAGSSTQASPQLTQASPQLTRASPQLTRASPQLTRASPQLTRASPQLTRASPQLTRASPQLTRASPQLTRASPQLTRASPQLTRASPQLTQASPQLTQASPQLTQASPQLTLASPPLTLAAPPATTSEDLRNQVEQYIPNDGVLYRDGDKILCRLAAGRNVVVVMRELGRKVSDDKQGFLISHPRYLQVQKETRYKRVFDPGNELKNVPHRCMLPEGFSRGIKLWPRSKEGLRVSYFSNRWDPSPATSLTQIKKCLSKHFITPYPGFMTDFNPYTCYCKSNYDDPASYFYED